MLIERPKFCCCHLITHVLWQWESKLNWPGESGTSPIMWLGHSCFLEPIVISIVIKYIFVNESLYVCGK